MEKKRILLLDMYGVIIKESKGYFIPYTFEHFDKKEHDRLTKTFREECLFTIAGNGDLSSDEFLSMLGYPNPTETMQDRKLVSILYSLTGITKYIPAI